ncbi:uncharacterized protein CLAFUR5_05860 [Fulvia fulva]|uniref:NAD-dependent epimerase/dehydratase domain-containing protein n=1 Tax=Passalora fulva TaxID=5499 RepID=A0A9Q8LHV5_PASFU|nr:uncharacterized protein CLAFUR5_05860 [Fulvia fulva]KAK4625546.1 hypothetical protein CLAFUR0_05722 [Fulvia fulva]UJO17688.1 hypothetical protein CLAFUR5_05860 [Fulvia fulva]
MHQPDVLVTGSAGHLGHALMLELPRRGYTPIGLDIKESHHTTHIGSVSDRPLIAAIFAEHPSLRHVLHTATLHKPHVGSHPKDAFVATNIQGTLVLLEEASKSGKIEAFIFTSTTSTFGAALAPKPGEPAAWIDESVVPIPKNICGTTKVAAEDLCQLVHNETKMPVLVLKTSRFFPEQDDNEVARQTYSDDNLKVNELTYRRADIADVVDAHICAIRKAKVLGWGKYNISAPPPFQRTTEILRDLDVDAAEVIKTTCPKEAENLVSIGWRLPARIDRVYDSSKAIEDLDWKPVYTFARAVARVIDKQEWRSPLTLAVGKRGYHAIPTDVYTS